MAGYYCLVDFVLVFQWLWYEHLVDRWGFGLDGQKKRYGDGFLGDGSDDNVDGSRTCLLEESKDVIGIGRSGRVTLEPVPHSNPKDIFMPSPSAEEMAEENHPYPAAGLSPSSTGAASDLRSDDRAAAKKPSASSSGDRIADASKSSSSSRKINRHVQSPSPSSPVSAATRAFAYVALIIAISSASSSASPTYPPNRNKAPFLHGDSHLASIHPTFEEPSTVIIGRVVSWLSTFLYLGSRLPQIIKNFLRRSTAGLSLSLFIAAFFGNFFYASSILANPCAWDSYGPHGARGWVGPEGNDRADWISRATPFWLGAAGVLMMDAAVGLQFWMYGDGEGVIIGKSKDGHHHHHYHTRKHGKRRSQMGDSYVTEPLGSQRSHLSYGSIDDPASKPAGSSKLMSTSTSGMLKRSGHHAAATAAVPSNAASIHAHETEMENTINRPSHSNNRPTENRRRWHRNVSGWMRGWVPGTPLGPGFFRPKQTSNAETGTETETNAAQKRTKLTRQRVKKLERKMLKKKKKEKESKMKESGKRKDKKKNRASEEDPELAMLVATSFSSSSSLSSSLSLPGSGSSSICCSSSELESDCASDCDSALGSGDDARADARGENDVRSADGIDGIDGFEVSERSSLISGGSSRDVDRGRDGICYDGRGGGGGGGDDDNNNNGQGNRVQSYGGV